MNESADHDNDALTQLLTSRAPLLQQASQKRLPRTCRQRADVGITKATETLSRSDHAEPAESMQVTEKASWRAVPKRISGDLTE